MSRAFVKEIDDASEIVNRLVSDAPNFVTPRGATMIKDNIASINSALAADASEAEAVTLSRDLRYWIARRSTMKVVQAQAASAVSFGTTVVVRRRGRKTAIAIVGEDEADPTSGKVAWTSPLARALLGAEPGEEVDFEAGGTEETILVVSVEPLPS